MITKELQKLNRLEKEVKTLKFLMANLLPYDNEGEYKNSFLRQIEKVSKDNSIFEYKGRGSLMKRLAKNV